MQCLYHAYLEEFEKCWPDRFLHATIFKRVLDIIRIKIRRLKGKNKWESSGSLDSNDWALQGLKLLKGTN